MYGINSRWWPGSGFPRSAVPIKPYTIYSQIPVYLGGKPGTEKVVIYISNTNLKTKAEILKYDEETKKWGVEYAKEAEGVPFFQVLGGYWEVIKRNVLVLYTVTGSGGFLNYTVVGRKQGKLVEFTERKEIFQGQVWFEGGRLLEGYGNRYRIWRSGKGRLIPVPYILPKIPGALLIEYSITKDGTVRMEKDKYTVPVGSVVQISRTDLNPIAERILFGYLPILKFMAHGAAFQVTGKGRVEFSIIPGGYDWDKAVRVAVEAS